MLRTKTTAGFSDLFHWCKKFDIHWNTCCDLFHTDGILNYRGHTEIYMFDWMLDVFYDDKDHPFYIDYEKCSEWKAVDICEYIRSWGKEVIKNEKDPVKQAKMLILLYIAEHGNYDEVTFLGD